MSTESDKSIVYTYDASWLPHRNPVGCVSGTEVYTHWHEMK